jgi:hypothetical protein
MRKCGDGVIKIHCNAFLGPDIDPSSTHELPSQVKVRTKKGSVAVRRRFETYHITNF